MDGVAYIFLNRNGANGLGHVGGAFLMENGMFRCFATENPSGKGLVPSLYKCCWVEDCGDDLESVIATFQKTRTFVIPEGATNIFNDSLSGTYVISNKYTDWKRLDVSDIDSDRANAMLQKRRGEDYHVLDRNCQNDVYDVLHDEGSGYGITANGLYSRIYVGGVQQIPIGPDNWFDNHVGASDQGST